VLFVLGSCGSFPYKGNGEGIGSDDFLTSIGIGVDFSIYDVVAVHLPAGKSVVRREGGRTLFTGDSLTNFSKIEESTAYTATLQLDMFYFFQLYLEEQDV